MLNFKKNGIFSRSTSEETTAPELQGGGVVAVWGSPGSGKTTTLMATINALKDDLRIGVMEADIDSDVDAATISTSGAKVIQLHTGGMCHLDAGMTRQGL